MPISFVGSCHNLAQLLDKNIRLGIRQKGSPKCRFLNKIEVQPILKATAKRIAQAEVAKLQQEGHVVQNPNDPIFSLDHVLDQQTFTLLKDEFKRRYSSFDRVVQKRRS